MCNNTKGWGRMSLQIYRQTWSRREFQSGVLGFKLTIADEYNNLFLDEPDVNVGVVNFLTVPSIKQDLNDEDGRLVEDEISIELNEAACENDTEFDCVDFILQCSDVSEKRYLLLEIQDVNSSTWVVAYRGVFKTDISGDDIAWSGAEFSDTPEALRSWKVSAGTYEHTSIDLSLDELIGDGVAWNSFLDTECPKSIAPDTVLGLTYEYATPTPEYGVYYQTVATYDRLVSINNLLRFLFDRATSLGATDIEFIESPLPFAMSTPHISPLLERGQWSGAYYIQPYGGDAISSWTYRETHVVNNAKLGDGFTAFYVDAALLSPNTAAELPYSWMRYKTLVSLLYGLARSLGMYPKFEYTPTGTLQIRFLNNETVTKNNSGVTKVTYIRDVESGSVDSKPAEIKADENKFTGATCPYALDGVDTLIATSGTWSSARPEARTYNRSELFKTYPPSDNMLCVCIGVTTYKDGKILRLYGTNPRRLDYIGSDPTDDSRHGCMTSLMYLITTDVAPLAGDGSDSTYTCVRPVSQISIEVNGTQKDYTELTEYVNQYQKEDAQYYASEYSLDVPFLAAFKRSPSGSLSYFNIDVGSTVLLDGRTFVVVGLERNLDELKTKIRMQYLERFAAYSRPTTVQLLEGGQSGDGDESTTTGESSVRTFVAAEPIEQFQAVALMSDGLLWIAKCEDVHYNKVVGVALNGASIGEDVSVCVRGPVTWSHAFDVGSKLWLRKTNSLNQNIQQDRVRIGIASEYIDQLIGYVQNSTTVYVDIGRAFIHFIH